MVPCLFANIKFTHGEEHYGCCIQNIQTPENKRIDVYGFHKNGRTYADVIHIKFFNCNIMKIPPGLTEIFPNIKDLVICSSKLKKINKVDLFEYKNLEIISMMDNEIEFLPGDLFDGFENLNYINFKKNKLTLIEPNILDGLKSVRYVDFSNNVNYEKCFSIYPVHEPNATFEDVKNELLEKFYSRYEFLQEQRTTKINLEQEIQKLKFSKKILEYKNEHLEINEEKLKLEIRQLIKKLELKDSKPQDMNLSTNLIDNFKNYIQNEQTKDFKIIIDEQEFLVHKILLIIQSPTLAEILRNNPDIENLNLIDIPIPIFERILKFLYTDEFVFDNETSALPIFAAAGRLKLQKLIDCAAEKLFDQINPKNVLEILNLSAKFQKNELKVKAFEEVKKKYPNIKFKDEWLENSEKLKFIIDMLKEKEEANRKFEEKLKKMAIMD